MAICVEPVTGLVGAVVNGIDLRGVGPGEVGDLRQAWLEHQVLFFPKQQLGPAELVSTGALFGEVLRPHGGLERHPENPDVMLIATRKGEGDGKYNDIWHSDVTFDPEPPTGSLLQADVLPAVGGDTLFISMYAAWESLSAPLKTAVENLHAFHDAVPSFTPYLLDPATPDGPARLARLRSEKPGVVHPVVVRHPETGRRALFVNRAFTQRLLGLSDIESRRLLDLLFEHCEQASFQARWRWSPGDIAFWDNRCTMHYAAKDYGARDRIMSRVTLKGSRPCA